MLYIRDQAPYHRRMTSIHSQSPRPHCPRPVLDHLPLLLLLLLLRLILLLPAVLLSPLVYASSVDFGTKLSPEKHILNYALYWESRMDTHD